MVRKIERKLFRNLLNTTACMMVVTAFAHESFAAPEGSLVVGGAAIVQQSGTETVITQSSNRAIIRWNSFDVAQPEKVKFQQPNSNSITINRITDTKASRIDGEISANGKVVMINPNGIVFGSTSRVDVGSLVATTSDIENDIGFINGDPARFTKAGNPNAKIINSGTITAKEAGLVGLVAPQVENNGMIEAHLGKVQLASGDIHTIDMAGDGLIQLEVSDAVITQSIKNTGTLKADGGSIILSAAEGRATVDAIISNHGKIQTGIVYANHPSNAPQKGKIVIAAPTKTKTKSKIIEGGTLWAEGGAIEIIGDTILIEKTSAMSVAAAGGGGSILIGGAKQGGLSHPTARLLTVEQGSTINASALEHGTGGDVILWSDERTDFNGHITSNGGALSGDGGFVEVSGKNKLAYKGYVDLTSPHGKTGTLLLDPTNIVISAAADSNVSGASPFSPTADDATSVLNVTTLTTALASASVVVQTRATGSQAGNITVSAPIAWGSGNTLTLDAHNNIIINQAITGQNLTLIAGGDVQANAALSGSGILTILPATDAQTIGIGTSSVGTLHLNATDLSNITNGWNQIIIGKTTGTALMDVRATTWQDNLLLRSNTGIISIAGAQTMGANNLSITTDNNPAITGALTGTGILSITGSSSATSIGLGTGQTGTLSLNNTELGLITSGWSSIEFGSSSMSAGLNIGALTWTSNPVFKTGTGVISVNGNQNFGIYNSSFQTDADIALNANLSGTGTVSFLSNLTGTTFGLAGGAGTLNLDATELSRIQSGFNLIQFGSGLNNPMQIGAYTWQGNVLFSNQSAINFTGAQDFGIYTATIRTDTDPIFAALLSGTGTLAIEGQTLSTSIGVGTAQPGTLSLDATDLTNIAGGTKNIVIGRVDGTGAVTVGANTWNDNLELRSGTGILTIAGAQNMGASNLTLSTGSDAAINAALTGTGNITLQGATAATTMGIGTGQPGLLSLNATDLGNITNGWANIILGRTDATGTMTVGANTWNDNLELRSASGIISVVGAQSMGANTLTLSSAGDAQINAALTGTSTLTLRGIAANTTIGVGTGQTGALQLNNTDIGNITNGWADIVIGRTDGTGAINAGALTWNDNLTYQAASGILTVAGVQTMGANTLTISTDSASNINAGLTGTGTLNLRSNTASGTMGFGNAQPGAFQFDNADVGNITNGWSNIVIGRTDGTGATTIGALTWNDNLTLQSQNAAIVIAGTQTLGANNVTFTTDGDPQINAAMNSTGTLTFRGLTDATTIGVGTGQAGSLSLSNTDLANADNTWGSIVIGRTTQTGDITVGGGFTLADPLTLQSTTGVITVGATGFGMGANNLTIQTDADPVFNGNLSGTGTISILPMSNATTIGIGTGEIGLISLTNAEQARIVNGWGNIIFGRTNANGAINVGTGLTWNDHLFLRTTDVITFAGAQSFGGNNLTLQTNSDPVINGNLNGTGGTFTLQQISNAVSMGLGDAQTGVVNLTNAELNRIPNGWGSLVFGLTTTTADFNVGAYTWNDPLTLQRGGGAGAMNINGAQSMGNNALTLRTDSNLNIGGTLSGTGANANLTITPNTNVSMGLGDGQAGTLSLTNAELNNILNGWNSLAFGLTTSTQAVNVGAYTWQDHVTIRNGAGLMTIAGIQNTGANNLSLLTNGDLALDFALNGSGSLTIAPSGSTTMGIGTGQAGTLSLTDTELARIANTWTSMVFGSAASTQAVNVGAYTWDNPLTVRSGTGLMTIAGAQTMGANNLSIETDSNLALNANLTGTGILTLRAANNGTTTSIGTGQIGAMNIDDTELTRIIGSWTRLNFGHTAATGTLNIGAKTWSHPVRFLTNTGVINVNGAQNMGANNLEIYTNANPTFNAAISGTNTFTIQGATAATGIGIGDGQVGAIQLSNADIGYITTNWNNIIFGYNGMTGAMNIGAYNWQYNTSFRSGSGLMTVNGNQNTSNKNMNFETDSNLTLNGDLQGAGILTIRGSANGTTMGIGTGQAGTLSLVDSELNRIINGWSEIVFGQSASTGAVNLGAYTWNDKLHLISNTGLMTVAGIQTMGANDLILETNSDLALNAALNGTGQLEIKGAAVGTTIGVNGGAGTLALTTAEIANITDGWGGVIIGRQDMTGAISLGAATWQNPTTFLTRGNVNISGTQTSTETSGTSLVFVTQAANFVNSGGAGAINPGGGRYLIYAVSAGATTLGGLTPATTINAQTYFSLPPASVVPTGNVIIYNTGATKIIFLQIDDKAKVYGDSLPIFTYTYLGGLQGADTLAAAITAASLNAVGASVTDNAGTTTAITGSFTTGLGYTTNVTNGTLTVIKAPVAVQASAVSRAYGAANPALTVNYIGLKNGETSAVIDTLATASTTANALSNVGSYNITTSGAADNNYIFNFANNTLTVTKANLTVTADNKTREYGDANPAFTLSYSGFVNSETSAVIDTLPTLSTTATTATLPSSVAITATGGLDNNYNLVLVNGTLTITKANLTVTADNKSRVYGDANPTLTYTYGTFKNGETSSVLDTLPTISTAATATTAVGTPAITLSGGLDNAYNYVFVDGLLTITKASLVATAQNTNREYGDANPTFLFNYTGFKNSETSAVIDTLATGTTTATATTNVGTATITGSGAVDNNYNFTYVDGLLNIIKANLTVTADNKTREYGDANPALTATYTGFKNGETSAVIDTLPTLSTTATLATTPSSVPIIISGGLDNNYNLNLVNGALTITKANLTVTADNKTREYGDANPALTLTYGTFKNGQTSTILDVAPTISTAANATTNAGTTSTITLAGGSDDYYNYVFVDGLMTITKANLTVTADNKTREYGDANPALTLTYGAFKNGETSAVLDATPTLSTAAIPTSNAGTAAITLSGGSDNNYNLNLVNGTLTIDKAPLVIQINNATRIEGDANPPFSYNVVSGLKFMDPASSLSGVALSTPANIFSPLGLYAINGSGGTATNYFVSSYLPGVLTITTGVLPPMPSSLLPDTFFYSNSIAGRVVWNTWRDIIFYEDDEDEFIEKILLGRQVVERQYRL